MRVAALLVSLGSLGLGSLGCRDRSSDDKRPAAPRVAITRDAGTPDATRAADALAPAPGTWPYTRPLSRCAVQVLTAPPTERAKAHDAAVARFAALGGTATVEMTTFGDRVSRVDLVGAKRPPRPPRTSGEAQLFALGAISPYADLFGLTVGEMLSLSFSSEHMTDIPGMAWEIFAMLERKPTRGMTTIGSDEVLVDLDRNGAPVTLRVGNNILPPLTTCADTLSDDEVRRAVIGTRLARDYDGDHYDDGTVEAGDITKIERKETIVRGSGYDGDVVAGAVYQVTVHKNDTPWWIFVDPSTSEILETRQAYDD